MKIIVSDSLGHWEKYSSPWNRLWEKSTAESPMARAETVSWWVRFFGKADRFRAVMVELNGELVAGVPLILDRHMGFAKARLPFNEWTEAGAVMVDTSVAGAAEKLWEGVRKLRFPVVNFVAARTDEAGWQAFAQASPVRESRHMTRRAFEVGRVRLDSTWELYEKGLSKNFRKNMRKAHNRLEELGEITFDRMRNFEAKQLEERLFEAFTVEVNNWKGREGKPVLTTGDMFTYFLENARRLNSCGAMEVHFLRLNGRPIAFEYGYVGKKCYFSHKIGYDEEFAKMSPGHVLISKQLQEFYSAKDVVNYDAMTAYAAAMSMWANEYAHRSSEYFSFNAIGDTYLRLRQHVPQYVRYVKGLLAKKSQAEAVPTSTEEIVEKAAT